MLVFRCRYGPVEGERDMARDGPASIDPRRSMGDVELEGEGGEDNGRWEEEADASVGGFDARTTPFRGLGTAREVTGEMERLDDLAGTEGGLTGAEERCEGLRAGCAEAELPSALR